MLDSIKIPPRLALVVLLLDLRKGLALLSVIVKLVPVAGFPTKSCLAGSKRSYRSTIYGATISTFSLLWEYRIVIKTVRDGIIKCVPRALRP